MCIFCSTGNQCRKIRTQAKQGEIFLRQTCCQTENSDNRPTLRGHSYVYIADSSPEAAIRPSIHGQDEADAIGHVHAPNERVAVSHVLPNLIGA